MAVDQVEKAIVYLLKNDADVAALIGARAYSNYAPQDAAVPYIVYRQSGGPRDHTLDGPEGFAAIGLELACWDNDYATARDLADKVRKLLDGYSGTVGSVTIQVIHLVNEADGPAMDPRLLATKRYSKELSFTVWISETP